MEASSNVLSGIRQTLEFSSHLEDLASKRELAECAKILALKVAHYQAQFGKLSLPDMQAQTELGKGGPSDEQIKLINQGMNNLISVLGTLVYDRRKVDRSTVTH